MPRSMSPNVKPTPMYVQIGAGRPAALAGADPAAGARVGLVLSLFSLRSSTFFGAAPASKPNWVVRPGSFSLARAGAGAGAEAATISGAGTATLRAPVLPMRSVRPVSASVAGSTGTASTRGAGAGSGAAGVVKPSGNDGAGTPKIVFVALPRIA